jgi:hypothetical protein
LLLTVSFFFFFIFYRARTRGEVLGV